MTSSPGAPTDRFAFANQLRGLAAVCVVINHYAGVYWSAPQVVAGATFSVVQAGAPPAFTAISAGAGWNLGPFGVALFFLISGFVIPLSLERQSVRAFVVGRVFRIYPTYMCALLLGLAAVALGAWYWQLPVTFTARTLVTNFFLINDVISAPGIDLVNWTLMIELKFYLLIALLAAPVRRGNLTALFIVAVAILGITAISPHAGGIRGIHSLLRIFDTCALYVLYMLIGVVFSYHVRRHISTAAAVAAVTVLFGLFVACWPLTIFAPQFPVVTLNYGWALLVFGACYAGRRFVPRASVIDFFAAISYPLYVIHPLVGYTIMKLLIVAGHVDDLFATLIAFAVAVGLAFALHVTVERRSQAFGKALARSLFGPDPRDVRPAIGGTVADPSPR